jgi:hypothetical protein
VPPCPAAYPGWRTCLLIGSRLLEDMGRQDIPNIMWSVRQRHARTTDKDDVTTFLRGDEVGGDIRAGPQELHVVVPGRA